MRWPSQRRFYLGVLTLLAIRCVVVVGLRWYAASNDSAVVTEQDVYRAHLKLQGDQPAPRIQVTPLAEKKVVRLAVGSLGLADDDQNRRLADLVAAGLSGTQGLELVERQLDRTGSSFRRRAVVCSLHLRVLGRH